MGVGLYGRDFSNKKFKASVAKRGVFRFRAVLLGLLLSLLALAWFFKLDSRLVDFAKIMSNRFDGLIVVSVPKEWVFVDIKNSDFNDISPVFGSFGLRWVQKCSLKVCRSTVLKLKQAKLPVVWRGAPSVKGGLCRVDVGPYSSFFGMFAAKNRLFSIGFYGKVRFVVWLDSLRSFGV